MGPGERRMSEKEEYTFYKSHKVEDWISSQMYDTVFDQITEWFGVDEIGDLTEEQMNEVIHFRENVLNENSPLQWGYSDIIGQWENDVWEREQEEEE
jgi:hypothetical protein